MARRYSDAEKQAYHIGRGSVLPKDGKAREKMVRSAFGNDSRLISSYKQGRATAQKRKDNYLKRQRAKSRKKRVL